DMINNLAFEGGENLRPKAEAVADVVLRLRRDAASARVSVIYVNDNYGHWHSERSRIVEECVREDAAGRDFVRRIAPDEDDYFVIKPQFSGFYATNLPVLLPRLGVSRLVLTGIAADICVLFTAADAHMRQYDLWIPADAVASETDDHRDWALEIMRKTMSAETRPTSELSLADWTAGAPADREQP
ncbi:MAG: cysteine hydrolase, partial [Acetobacteraceae bacterium]|nr:cysteine hydrolase [Acetobacteraceae bacterium]